jgi:hypothetical protein
VENEMFMVTKGELFGTFIFFARWKFFLWQFYFQLIAILFSTISFRFVRVHLVISVDFIASPARREEKSERKSRESRAKIFNLIQSSSIDLIKKFLQTRASDGNCQSLTQFVMDISFPDRPTSAPLNKLKTFHPLIGLFAFAVSLTVTAL